MCQSRILARQQRAYIGQQRERVAQAGEVARAGVAQGDAPADAFHIGAAFQQPAELISGIRPVGQSADGVASLDQYIPITQRMMQPVAQQARAHAAGGGVEHRQQGRRGFAAQGFGQFQIAPGGGVELHVVAVALGVDRLKMRQCSALGSLNVIEQSARRSDGLRQIGHAKCR